jgi:acyl carrier protein
MPAAALAGDPLTLLDATERFHIERWFITNSLAAAVLAAAERSQRSWDLGALRQVALGGETVQHEITRRLSDLLTRHGAMAVAIRCGYGTTETGPLVTGADALAASGVEDGAVALGGCAPGVALRIVGPSGECLLEGQAGQVHAFCPKVMFSCYWRAPEGDDGRVAGGWWNTGDVGQLRGGQLILNGRSKETINVHGKKYPLAEIDSYLQSAIGPGVRAYACAVHWPGRPTETLAVAYVADGRYENRAAIAEAIRLAVTHRFALQASPIIALTADQIPLTGSGKLRRLELSARLRRGDFGAWCRQDGRPAPDGDEPLANAASVHGPVETAVAVAWAEVAGSDAFRANLPLERAGVDSLKLLTVIFRIELILGCKIPFDLLRADMTPSMLISEIGRLGEGQRPGGHGPGTEPIGGPLDHDLPTHDLPEVVAEVVNHSRKPGATLADRIYAATLLLVFGYVERARAILSALPSQPAVGQTEMLRLCDRLDVGRQLLQPGRQEELDVMVSHNPRAKRVVLVFPGQGGRFWGFNEPVFLYRDDASIVFMRDTGEFHYLHGIRGLGTTYGDCLAALRAIVRVIGGAADQAMPLHCMGHSTGAYAALRFGVDLRADSVLAFSGPTNLDIGDQSESDILRWPLAALRASAPGLAADLRSLYAAATHPPKVLICYGADHPQDASAARHMAGLPGVLLRPIVGFGGHDTLGEAMRLKRFEALVDEMQMHVSRELGETESLRNA